MTPARFLAAPMETGQLLALATTALVLGVVTVVGLVFARRQADRASALRRADVLSAHQAAARAAETPTVCEIPGAAAYGPNGPLTAPMSGRPCVWYHVRVSERRQRLRRRTYGLRGGIRYRTVQEETSAAPFAIVDQAARVLVHPQGITADFIWPPGTSVRVPMPRTVCRYEPVERNTLMDLATAVLGSPFAERVLGHLYEEWCIPEGMPIFVLGQVRADRGAVEVVQPADGPFVLSITPPQQQAAIATYGARLRYHALAVGVTVAAVIIVLVLLVAR